MRSFAQIAVVLAALVGLSACGDTWQGLKQDTGENTEAVGQTLERTGERIEGESTAP